jgi:hypothetical protein
VELDAPTLDALLERLGRTWVPPFDGRAMSRIIESLCEGLLYQSELEPDLVTADLFADALSAILLTFSSTGSATSVSLHDFGLAEGVAPVYDVHRAQEAAVAALAVFDRDPADLTLVQVALETGQQVAELVGLFGTVRRMAAVSFVAVYPRLVEAANRHLISDPYRALVDGLCEIARMGRSHPYVARALLAERTGGPEDDAEPLPVDIRMAVPVGMALVNPLRRTEHVPSADMARVIGDLVDTTLRLSAENPRRSPADIAVEALGALPSRQVSSPG